MRIQENVTRKNNIAFVMIFYWAVLVAWQATGIATRSLADSILKIGLLAILALYIVSQNSSISASHAILVMLFVLTQLIPFSFEPSVSMSLVISYIFPTLFLFLTYGVGDHFCIKKAV